MARKTKNPIRKKFSVVLNASVCHSRTVIVRAASAFEAEMKAVRLYAPEYGALGGWEVMPDGVDTFAYDAQEAGRGETVTEGR